MYYIIPASISPKLQFYKKSYRLRLIDASIPPRLINRLEFGFASDFNSSNSETVLLSMIFSASNDFWQICVRWPLIALIDLLQRVGQLSRHEFTRMARLLLFVCLLWFALVCLFVCLFVCLLLFSCLPLLPDMFAREYQPEKGESVKKCFCQFSN